MKRIAAQRWLATTLAAAMLAAPPLYAQAPQAITMDQALRIALRQNGDLRIARNSALLDAAAVKQARSQFLPDLRLSTQTGQSYGRSFNESEGRIVDQMTNSASAGVSSSVTLFDGFQNVANARAAALSERASEQGVARAEQTVVFTVATNFVNLVTQHELLRVQRENLAAQEAEERQIKAFVDAGSRPISDLYQQQAAAATTQLALVNAERAVELAKVDIMQTLQLDPTGDYAFVLPAVDSSMSPSAPFALDSLLARALSRRVDVDARETLVGAAAQDVRAAQASRWPTLSVSAGYNTAFSSASDIAFSEQLNQRRGGSIGVGVSIPLFDRSSTDIATQRARIAEDNARLALENQKQQVGLEVRRAYLDFNAAQQQLVAAKAQERAAALALESTSRRYVVGAATLLEVTQSRATMLQAASALVNARYSLVLQRQVMAYYTGDLDVGRPATS